MNYVRYPHRYLPKLFDSNIVFLYVLFPLSCVMYNQFTYKMSAFKSFLSVFLFSTPMTLLEKWLEKYTNLVKYQKGWNGYFTFTALSFTFLLVKFCIQGIRTLNERSSDAVRKDELESMNPTIDNFISESLSV